MKTKIGISFLLSFVMVIQLSVMAFATEEVTQPRSEEIVSTEENEDQTTYTTEPGGGTARAISLPVYDENGEEQLDTTMYMYSATPDANHSFAGWYIAENNSDHTFIDNDKYEYRQSFTNRTQIDNLVALFIYYIAPTIVESDDNPAPAPVQVNTEPEVPEEPDTTGQITITDTSAGFSLPTPELGEALTSTRTLSLNMSHISPRQFSNAVQDTVAKTPDGGNFVIETNQVACFDKNMMKAFADKPTVNIYVVFKNKLGKKVLVTIPAGYDVMSLLDDNGYCGFQHLADVLGSKEL